MFALTPAAISTVQSGINPRSIRQYPLLRSREKNVEEE
jgi:hypothetical protein